MLLAGTTTLTGLYAHSNIVTVVTFLMYYKIHAVFPIAGVFEVEEGPTWALF